MTPFQLRVGSYLSHKLGSERQECEDALAFNSASGCFAVSDGATEAFASQYWSRLLVRAWTRLSAPVSKSSFLHLVEAAGERANKRWEGKALPWYAAEKAQAGSFAAFVGAKFAPDCGSVHWKVIAIGDCCFIHMRNGVLLRAIPLSEPEQFGFRPLLLPTILPQQDKVKASVQEHEGFAHLGDCCFLMSDAIACWFLASLRSGDERLQVFDELMSTNRHDELDIFFDDQRASLRMKNDDIAAVQIRIG